MYLKEVMGKFAVMGKKTKASDCHFNPVGVLYLEYIGKEVAMLLVHLAGCQLGPQLSPSSFVSYDESTNSFSKLM